MSSISLDADEYSLSVGTIAASASANEVFVSSVTDEHPLRTTRAESSNIDIFRMAILLSAGSDPRDTGGSRGSFP